MPNHIVNKVVFDCEPGEMEAIYAKYNTHHEAKLYRSHEGNLICLTSEDAGAGVGWFIEKKGVFFRQGEHDVVGIPEGYEIQIKQPVDQFPDFRKIVPQPKNIFLGDLSKEEEHRLEEEGIPTWYKWNIENWGTKWNCYSCRKILWNTFTFETAWNGVPDLIRRISCEFPWIEISYKWADEDSGQNVGDMVIFAGVIQDSSPENGTDRAYEIYEELSGRERDEE